jgi:REP-associated tyrosine transposase
MTVAGDYRRGRHVVSAVHVHLVLVTKYRRDVLTGEYIRFQLKCSAKCAATSAPLVERNEEDDHMHLLARHQAKVSVATLVNSFKDVSAPILRQRCRVRTHRDHLWSPSHFTASRGGVPLSIIRHYPEQQRTPAANPRPERRGLRRQISGHGSVSSLCLT